MPTAKKTTTKKTESRSGNPAKRAAAKQASEVSAFKKMAKGISLPLPSGLVCTAKRVELQSFLMSGNVPNPLMEIVSEALEKGQKANISEMVGVDEGKINMDMVRDMYDTVNRIVIASFVAPRVHAVPELDAEKPCDHEDCEEPRCDEVLYIDELDDEDKMFVYQWATGGTDDIATFREQARADMDALAKIQGVGAATE